MHDVNTSNEICLPGGGGESQVWCVRASPHLMPTESGPIHRRMHEVINHSIITALTFTFARCALGYHAACRGGTLPEETPEQPPSSRARTGQPSASDPAVGRARGVQACRTRPDQQQGACGTGCWPRTRGWKASISGTAGIFKKYGGKGSC